MKLSIQKYRLDFTFRAGTSRGVMTSKDSWFLKLADEQHPDYFGLGECGPLPGLSPDLAGDLPAQIEQLTTRLDLVDEFTGDDVRQLIPPQYPALRFALETALLDLKNGGKRMLFDNAFSRSSGEIPINGLVWMGEKPQMLQRIKNKIEDGFTCIKIKIGAIDFGEELSLLRYIRKEFGPEEITIRLDANGAFSQSEALEFLKRLSEYHIHSIEQPIAQGDWEAMAALCDDPIIPIALDEELIGIHENDEMDRLLETIKPQYIILKPTLVGGLQKSASWISKAKERNIGWWVTSALESNIGLNAIAQFTANYPIEMPQGLGTGQLFHNNIGSPLQITNGYLKYAAEGDWDLSSLEL